MPSSARSSEGVPVALSEPASEFVSRASRGVARGATQVSQPRACREALDHRGLGYLPPAINSSMMPWRALTISSRGTWLLRNCRDSEKVFSLGW